MRLFSFDWFKSAERLEYEKLKLENVRLENKLLLKKLYKETHEESVCKEKIEEHKPCEYIRPFKKAIYSNGIVTIVPWEGDPFSGEVDEATFKKIENATNIIDVLSILVPQAPKIVPVVDKNQITEEEIKAVEESKHILEENDDFEFRGGEIFLKGVNLALVPVVLASFIEIEEKLDVLNAYKEGDDEKHESLLEIYEALKFFWRWTALNPIESSRQDLLNFVQKNDIAITSNGLMEMYRRVNKVEEVDREEIDFISSSYLDIRKKKKATGAYKVIKYVIEGEVSYSLAKEDETEGLGKNVGNLKDLYVDLPNRQENRYTDAHSGSKDIRIGQIYREDEDKIDLNNRADCSNGLHVGGRSFGFDGVGNTGVMVLVNPMKVRAVPVYSTSKMRVSEMFIVGLMEESDYKSQVGIEKVIDYSQEYFNTTVEEIEEILKDKTYEKLSVQGHKPAIEVEAIVDIANVLKSRVIVI